MFGDLNAAFQYQEVSDPNSSVAAANGQFILIKRSVYFAVGGHEAIRTRVLDDVALAKLVKSHHEVIFFRYAPEVVRTRMYRSFQQLWEGWSKNLASLFERPLWLAVRRLAEFALILTGLIGIIVFAYGQKWLMWGLSVLILLWFSSAFGRRIAQAGYQYRDMPYAFVGLPIFTVLLATSVMRIRCRHRVTWRGRVYEGADLDL